MEFRAPKKSIFEALLLMMTQQLSNDCKLTWEEAFVKAQYRDIWK